MPEPQELECLAKAVYHESRGEPYIGQVAVAHVIINRRNSDLFPDTICAVVYQPSQFTDLDKRTTWQDHAQWDIAIEVSIHALLGLSDDPAHGAMWFYAPKKVQKPSWALRFEQKKIGNHMFLRNSPGAEDVGNASEAIKTKGVRYADNKEIHNAGRTRLR